VTREHEQGGYSVRDFLRRRHSFVDAAPSPARVAHSNARRTSSDEARAGRAPAGARTLAARPAPVQQTFDFPPPKD
jgi:hypothetical protein